MTERKYFWNQDSDYLYEFQELTGRYPNEWNAVVYRPYEEPYKMTLSEQDLCESHKPIEKQEFMRKRIKSCLRLRQCY
jgi:hypothetical protein